MTEWYWVVEVQIYGEPWRWSTRQLTALDGDGDAVDIDIGLQEEPIVNTDDTDTTLTILDPSLELLDLAEHVEAAPATLSRWLVGTTWEAREVVLSGRVVGLSCDTCRDPFSFGIEERTRDDRPILDARARVDAATWPIDTPGYATPESEVGVPYLRLFGVPGHVPGGDPRPVVPVSLCQYKAATTATSYALVADRTIPATQVWMRSDELGETGYQAVSQVDDDLGKQVSVANFDTTTALLPATLEEASKLYIGFSLDFGGGTERTAYDVIVALLRERSQNPIDWARLAETEEVLSAYQVDTWLTEPELRPWDWLALLLQDLPVEVRRSSRGRYLEVQRYHASADEARQHFDVEAGDLEARGPLSFVREDLLNELVVQYAQLRTGRWSGQVVFASQADRLDDEDDFAADGRIEGNPLCAVSRSRYERLSETLQVGWTWDEATARLVGLYHLDRRALPRQEGIYWAPDPEDLQAGSVVLVSDADRQMSQRVAIVAGQPLVLPTGGATMPLRFPPRL